mgnify:FL=1
METENLERRLHPHHATITFKLDIRKIDNDGNLDPMVMGNSLLKKYGISTKAQICVTGSTEADCIRIVKEKLEKLNG